MSRGVWTDKAVSSLGDRPSGVRGSPASSALRLAPYLDAHWAFWGGTWVGLCSRLGFSLTLCSIVDVLEGKEGYLGFLREACWL